MKKTTKQKKKERMKIKDLKKKIGIMKKKKKKDVIR